jgi:hypothetical protein
VKQQDLERIMHKYSLESRKSKRQSESESSHDDGERSDEDNYSHEKRPMKKKKRSQYAESIFPSYTLQEVKQELYSKIVGQPYAVESVAPTLSFALNRRFVPSKASQRIFHLLFSGPSGVGKTELTEAITSLFKASKGQAYSYLTTRLAMGTMHDVTQLNSIVGSGQGFAGYKDPCIVSDLVNANKKYRDTYGTDAPFMFLILDEICKSAKGWVNLLNSFFDKGELKGGSAKFTIPSRTFLFILSTANYGEYTNTPLYPVRSINDIRADMLHDGLQECDANRIREIIPFFHLKDEDRREIVFRFTKRLFQEFTKVNKSVTLHSQFTREMGEYILKKSLKDVRTLENQIMNVMISVADSYDIEVHEGIARLVFTSYDEHMSKCGDFVFINEMRANEYRMMMIENDQFEIPCVGLYNDHDEIIQCLVLPCNYPKEEEEEKDEEGDAEEDKPTQKHVKQNRHRHHHHHHSQKRLTHKSSQKRRSRDDTSDIEHEMDEEEQQLSMHEEPMLTAFNNNNNNNNNNFRSLPGSIPTKQPFVSSSSNSSILHLRSEADSRLEVTKRELVASMKERDELIVKYNKLFEEAKVMKETAPALLELTQFLLKSSK